jgi:hypothetical protein
MAPSATTRTHLLGLWLFLAILWVIVVVWVSFQITHAVFSRTAHDLPYLGLATPLLVAPWLLHRLDAARSRSKAE